MYFNLWFKFESIYILTGRGLGQFLAFLLIRGLELINQNYVFRSLMHAKYKNSRIVLIIVQCLLLSLFFTKDRTI